MNEEMVARELITEVLGMGFMMFFATFSVMMSYMVLNSLYVSYLKKRYTKKLNKLKKRGEYRIINIEAFSSKGVPTYVKVYWEKTNKEEIISVL